MLQDPNSIMGLLTQYGRAIGWSIAAAVGFAFGIGIALKVLTCYPQILMNGKRLKKGIWVFLLYLSP